MAVCTWCDREMTTASGCAVAELHDQGQPLRLTPWGREHGWPRPRASERCGDCGALPGGNHHPGCDIAECPRRGDQLLGCGCRFDEDPPDDDDDWDI